MGKKLQIKAGDRFGKLQILKELDPIPKKPYGVRRVVECKCDCGTIRQFKLEYLTIGHTTSCGCFHRTMMKEKKTKHGLGKESEYKIWKGMKYRCLVPTAQDFKHYGGRGIKIFEPWINDFVRFYQDVGKRPSMDHSIDRIDVNGNYEPGNVRWATRKEQANNRR